MASFRGSGGLTSRSSGAAGRLTEQSIQQMLQEYGVSQKPKKASALQRLSSGLGAFEWSDDALKTAKSGGNVLDFLGSYLVDIPRTVAGAFTGREDWVDADEGKGKELLKYMGVENPALSTVGGLAADILTPDLLISSALKGGTTATQAGADLATDIAGKGTQEVAATLTEKLGKEAGDEFLTRAAKMGSKFDVAKEATKLIQGSDEALGFAKMLPEGVYLGMKPETGKLILKGKNAARLGKFIESPLTAPFEVGGDLLKTTKVGGKATEMLEPMLEKTSWGRYAKKNGSYDDLVEFYRVGNKASFKGDVLKTELKAAFANLPEEQYDDIIKTVDEFVEVGGGLPQSSTLENILGTYKDSGLLSAYKYNKIKGNLEGVSQILEEDVLKMPFENLNEDVLKMTGDARPLLENRIAAVGEQTKKWADFTASIGRPDLARISTLEDVRGLSEAIKGSDLPDTAKQFYEEFLVNRFRGNALSDEARAFFDLPTFGMGYAKRSYTNYDDIEKVLDNDVKVNKLTNRARTYPSLADVEVANKYNDLTLNLDKSMKTLIDNTSSVKTQQELAMGYKNFLQDSIWQIQGGEMPGFATLAKEQVQGGVPKTIDDLASKWGEQTLQNSESILTKLSQGGDKALNAESEWIMKTFPNMTPEKQGEALGRLDEIINLMKDPGQKSQVEMVRKYMDIPEGVVPTKPVMEMAAEEIPEGWRKTGIKMLDQAGVIVDNKTWDLYKDVMSYTIAKDSIPEAMKVVNKANNLWKLAQTGGGVNVGGVFVPLNPAFFGQQFINNKISSVLYGGMNPGVLPKRYTQGINVLRVINGKGDPTAKIGNFTAQQLADEFIEKGGMSANLYEVIGKEAMDKGIGSKLERFLAGGGKSIDVTSSLENADKVSLFIDQRLKGKSITDALNKVDFALFDYNQLTDAEKVFKKNFAFYTWTKKNLQSFITTLGTDPKRMGIFDDVFDSLSGFAKDNDTDIEAILPDYLSDLYYVRMAEKDGQAGTIYGFKTPIESAMEMVGRDPKETAQNLLASLAPAQKILLEQATGQSFFKGGAIEEDDSAYTYRNLPTPVKKLMGIDEEEKTSSSGETYTQYKMDPNVKYALENLIGRPLTGAAKIHSAGAEITSGESVSGFWNLMDYLSGIRYKSYDVEYLKSKYERDKYLENMELLMDAGAVNKFESFYQK